MFGWILAGKTTNTNSEADKNFFIKNSQDEFERMCAMESLGISETKNSSTKTSRRTFNVCEMASIQHDYHGKQTALHFHLIKSWRWGDSDQRQGGWKG